MKLIFYDEATKILGVTIDTLKHAVSRGELTTAGTQGNRQRLIEEQVMLFTGVNPRTGNKKRISYNGLSEQEKALWNGYASELSTASVAPATPVNEEIVRRVFYQEAPAITEEIASSLIQSLQRFLSPKQPAIAR